MSLRLIACINADGNIDGFHPPTADLQRFQALTIGGTVIMGRKTWQSLPGRPLPHRRNIVVSRSLQSIQGADDVVDHWTTATFYYLDAWIIGGGELYAQAIDQCEWMFISHVPGKGGTVKFPIVRTAAFEQVARQRHPDHDLTIWRKLNLKGT